MTTRTTYCNEAEFLCAENSVYNTRDWLMGYGINVHPAVETEIVTTMTSERESQSQLHHLYQEYHPDFDVATLKKLSKELRNLVFASKDKANLSDIITDSLLPRPVTAYGQWLKEVTTDIEAAISGMNMILKDFFGEDILGTALEHDKNIAMLLAETVMMGYNLHKTDEDMIYKITSQLSLQNIVQWAIESYSIKHIYGSSLVNNGDYKGFTENLCKLITEKNETAQKIGDKILEHIAKRADVSVFYLKNIIVSLIKNNSYIAMIKIIEDKKEACCTISANDNYIDDIYQDDERLFRLLHIGTQDISSDTQYSVPKLFIGGETLQSTLLMCVNQNPVAEQMIEIHNKKYIISVEQSEDFENTAYDVTIVTMKDYTTGCIIGSMSMSEDMNSVGEKTFVAYQTPDTSSSEETPKIEEFMPNKISEKHIYEELSDNM